MFDVDLLTEDIFVEENKAMQTKQLSLESQTHLIDPPNVDQVTLPKINQKESRLNSKNTATIFSFSSDKSNENESKYSQKSIESPSLDQATKKTYKSLSNNQKYAMEDLLNEESIANTDLNTSKIKKCIKYPIEKRIEKIGELISEEEDEFVCKKSVSKKKITILSLSASSLSISDDNDSILNESLAHRKSKKCVNFQDIEDIAIENPEMKTTRKKAHITMNDYLLVEKSYPEDDKSHLGNIETNKCGTEWLKQISEKFNEASTHGDNAKNEETSKKTSPSLITVNTSNLYLSENDLKKRKIKFIKNGMAERLQKILIRQASSINFIKHQQIKNEKCKFFCIFFSKNLDYV